MIAPRRSLFLKLLLVMLLAALALNSVNDWTFRRARFEAVTRRAEQRVLDHVGYVLKDLGDPPSRAKAGALAEQGLWKFRYIPDAGAAGWAVPDETPLPADLKDWKGGPNWGWKKGSFYAVQAVRGGRLLLLSDPWRGVSVAWSWRAALAGASLLILLLAWAAIRWILQPVRWLDRGMARVAEGDLGHRIPTRSKDELGRLAEQFNAMAERVQAMLEQRRQLLLDVSHELRTPLTRLKLGLESLPEGEDREGLAGDVKELEALVGELLEGARLEAGQDGLRLEDCDLAALAQDVAASFDGREPGLRLDLPSSAPLRADAARLQRLLQNLLANAFAHGQPATGPVELSLRSAAGAAVLELRDHGPGVGAADLARLATPFFRADRSRTRASGGLGLGLHLCRRIAEAHGGSLELSAPEGGGLLVRVSLPSTPPSARP